MGKSKSKFNLENVTGKINEINQRLESKNQEADNLQKKYQDLYAERKSLEEDEELEDWVKDAAIKEYAENTENVEADAEKLKDSMNEDYKEIESKKQEVDNEIDSKNKQQEKLNKRKNFIENLGFTAQNMENAVNTLESQKGDLSGVQSELINTEKEMDKVTHKLNHLNSRTS